MTMLMVVPVESRLYKESMTGTTAKSKPRASKIDERELSRLQKKDFWLLVTRTKLIMDLVFVCQCSHLILHAVLTTHSL